MVSSAVFGFEELLDRLYAILDSLGFEVWMSHKGTVPVDSSLSALENCRQVVEACDLFLGIILPRYGSGIERDGGESITHEEIRYAIANEKPRWILAHEHVVVARALLRNLGFGSPEDRQALMARTDDEGKSLFKRKPPLDDLRIIDLYELATRHDVRLEHRRGNWVQTFVTDGDALLFATSQFRRYQEAEAFARGTIGDADTLIDEIDRRSGRDPEGSSETP
ncbi:hypothetical protein BSZ36_18210 [Rubricoccus marinus]|uniref:DUF4062 domain-containing protein n=2 Tax=Rubricoccus marinus TaxID=716817 RepID=A0A259TTX3_9BACT|nr:hypothetical protein BSZ36_18210 [Rubricoccus marinus]